MTDTPHNTPVTLANLNALTTPLVTDLIYLINDPAGTPTSKKVEMVNVAAGLRWKDSVPVNLGTADDATILYDGTNLVIDPKAVGSGSLKVAGDLQLSADNDMLVLGAGADAGIYYNGTDVILDTQLVGSGDFYVLNGQFGVGATPSQYFDVTISSSGGTVGARVQNTSGTANSNARFICKTAASGGDPYFLVTQASGSSWTFGMDTGSSSRFILCTDNSLSTAVFGVAAGANPDAFFTDRLAVGDSAGPSVAQLYIKQGSAAGAIPCLELDQDDVDEAFIEFDGTTAADATKSISSLTGGGLVTGFVRVSINGTDRWIPFYSAPTF